MKKAFLLLFALAGSLCAQPVEPGWPVLEQLTQAAPARQVGQPGHAFVDRWVEETFQRYVEKNGGLTRADYEASRRDYRSRIEAMLEKRDAIHLEEVSPMLWRNDGIEEDAGHRASFSRSVLLNPTPVFFLLSLALLSVAVAWWFQRRRGLVWLGGGMAAALAGLAVASTLAQRQWAEERASGQTSIAADHFASSAAALLPDGTRLHSWQRGRMTNYTAAFLPGPAKVKSISGEARLYQLAPNLVEPANLPAEGVEGLMVYAGSGDFTQVAAASLKGAIVVLEFDSSKSWLAAAELGARAIILLGPKPGQTLRFHEALSKTSNSPLSIPRLYLQREDASRLFGTDWEQGSANGQSLHLEQQAGRWERRPVYTDWIYIPGAQEAEMSELVHIQTYKDAASIVPELSPGAESAANLVAVDRLLASLSDTPPSRPVLLSVVDDHCNALNGEYAFASFAFSPPEAFAEELNRLDYLHSQKVLIANVYAQEPSRALVDYLRDSIERVGGRSFTVKEPAVNTLTMRRNTQQGEQSLIESNLKNPEMPAAERQSSQQRLKEIRAQVEETVTLMGLFNRFGHKTRYAELSEKERGSLAQLFAELSAKARDEADLLQNERLNIWENLSLRQALAEKKGGGSGIESLKALLNKAFPVLPSLASVQLDLGAGSDELGLFYEGEIRPATLRQISGPSQAAAQRTSRLARLSLDIAKSMAQGGERSPLRNTILGAGGQSWQSHLGARMAFGSSAFHQFARTAVTLASVADQRSVVFTPSDTLQQIDPARQEKTWDWTNQFLTRLISSDNLPQTLQTRGTSVPFTAELTVRKVDQFSVEIPRTVLGNALVMGFPKTPLEVEPASQVGQVRPFPMQMADAAGRLVLRGELWRDASVFASRFDETSSRIVAASDFGENERRFSSVLSTTGKVAFTSRSIVTFDCRKTDLLGFTNPLTLEAVPKVDVLDARNDSRVRNFSLGGIEPISGPKRMPLAFDGSASVFLPPNIPFKLRAGNILAIHTTPENPKGIGFSSDGGLVRELPLIMARDYESLASARLALLASKGVTSDSAESFAREGAEALAAAEAASRPVDRVVLAEEARGMAYQSYLQTVATINDLVKAVVILLALVVPFCFFLVKLLSPYTDVNRQLMLFMAVFAAFTALLYFIQPAFSVGDRPEVVILAFIILGMAVFVGSVILGKFDAAMSQAVEQSQLSESPEAPQGRLAGVAFMVGINNMKRRRIRTTLTCATIVLVTFTILSVISIQEQAEPLRLRVGPEAPYDGFVYVQPGMAPVAPLRLDRLRSHFLGKADTVTRSWTSRQDSYGGYMPYQFIPQTRNATAQMASLSATVLLGLETGERNFVRNLEQPEYLVPGSRWFSSNRAKELMLSRGAAALLGITPENFAGQKFLFNGQSYDLVGLYEDEAWADLRDLRNLPLLPLKMEAAAQQAGASDGESSDLTQKPGVRVASPLETVLLPIDTAMGLGSTTYRAFAVKYRPLEGEASSLTSGRLWTDVQKLLRYQDAYLSVGITAPVQRGEDLSSLEPGEYALASSSSAKLGGILKVAIPVILAATIILNTMLGSVMERKKEISIYNAIGLNPSHVMVFFLAEALVFGLVGSVAGYFIGQVLSVTLGQFMDINLNYSSMSVMVVIFLTISTVMLSTLYPASMAARAAVPSGQRKWSLPAPEGDEIHLRFPFSYDSRRILAVCAYLHDFMQQNSEASTGRFLARLRYVGRVHSESRPADSAETGSALAMVYDVTPIPFDLGVNQKMEIYADYDPQVKAHMLSVHLTRESGDRDSWITVNQPFLEALRKRLLAWRSQRAETQDRYYSAGEDLFRNTPSAPAPRPETGPLPQTA